MLSLAQIYRILRRLLIRKQLYLFMMVQQNVCPTLRNSKFLCFSLRTEGVCMQQNYLKVKVIYLSKFYVFHFKEVECCNGEWEYLDTLFCILHYSVFIIELLTFTMYFVNKIVY